MVQTTLPYTLSQEATIARKSLIRELIAQAVDPNLISFAAGLPPGDLMPVATFGQCINHVLARDGGRAMQYSPQYLPLREWIVEHMHARGVKCAVENVFITNGSQQGLTILSRLFLDPGQPAVVEEATFTGINLVTGGRGAQVRAIATDLETGADMDAFETALAQNPRPRLAVLIPDFHNPLGVSMSLEKRRRAAELSNRYGVPLIEDDPYSLLRFRGEALPSIKHYDETGTVFYLGSFSKMLAPGLRLGWMIAPVDLIPKITIIREALDLESSTLMQRAVAEFAMRGQIDEHLQRLNPENRRRCDAMLNALDAHLSDFAHWTQPDGGLFIWVTLPENMDTFALVNMAIEHGVVFIPGVAFASVGGQQNTMRLNFSNVPPDKIAIGIERLAQVIRPWLSLDALAHHKYTHQS